MRSCLFVLLISCLSLTANAAPAKKVAADPAPKRAAVAPPQAATPKDAKGVLDKVAKNVESTDESSTVKMIVTESNGQASEKKLELKRKGKGDKQSSLVRMLSPADTRGIALLSKSEGKSNDQWFYMPSEKKVRRILSDGKSKSFLGSELTYEDLSAGSGEGVTSKLLPAVNEGGKDYLLVENTPKGESTYARMVLWVNGASFLVDKIEYFGKDGKALKVSTFGDYKQFGTVWRAQKMEMKNLRNKRGTTLELSSVKLNSGISDGEFSESALAED